MSLRQKTLWIIGGTVLILALVLFAASQVILRTSISGLEHRASLENHAAALGALQEDIRNLAITCEDYAEWNDTYAYLESLDPDYIEDNVSELGFIDLKINLIAFVNLRGEVVFSRSYDTERRRDLPVPAELNAAVSVDSPLYCGADMLEGRRGLLTLSEQLMTVVVWPVLTNEGKGPARGALIMGRHVTEKVLPRLHRTTNLDIDILPADASVMPAEARAVMDAEPDAPPFYRVVSDDYVETYGPVTDMTGRTPLVLRVQTSRQIYNDALITVRRFYLFLIVVSLAFGAAVVWILERYVLSRISRLNAEVAGIARQEDLTRRVVVRGVDEIASLEREMNRMLERLERSARELREYQTTLEARVEMRTDQLERSNHQLQDEVLRRVHMESGLRASELKYRTLLENLPQNIYSRDRMLRFTSCNRAFSAAFGVTMEALSGRTDEAFLPQAVRAAFHADDERVARTGRAEEVEYSFVVDGVENVWFAVKSPTFDESGAVTGMLCIFWDVSESRRLQREVLDIETRIQRGIGQDLHDNLGQLLTGVSYLVKALEERRRRGDSGDGRQIAEISALLQQAIQLTRNLAKGLCPAELEGVGLRTALQELAAASSRIYEVPCAFECDDEIPEFPAEQAHHLYSIAKEAVINAIKHATPRRIHIQLTNHPGAVTLSVQNDGAPFLPSNPTASGLGMSIMKYRSSMIGGRLDVEKLAPGGAIVRVHVPLPVDVKLQRVESHEN